MLFLGRVYAHIDPDLVSDYFILALQKHQARIEKAPGIICVKGYPLGNAHNLNRKLPLQLFDSNYRFTSIPAKSVECEDDEMINSPVMLFNKTVQTLEVGPVKVPCAETLIFEHVNDLHVVPIAPSLNHHLLPGNAVVALTIGGDSQIYNSSFHF